MPARRGGPFLIDIDAKEASVGRQATGDANRAITCEGADFHGRAHLEHGCQQRQERALFAADEHLAERAKLLGLRPQIIEDRIGSAASMRCDVRTKFIVERNILQTGGDARFRRRSCSIDFSFQTKLVEATRRRLDLSSTADRSDEPRVRPYSFVYCLSMKTVRLTLPEIALLAGTRAAFGVGVGLLLSERLKPEQRQAVGWTLLVVGLLTTIPLGLEVLGKRDSGDA
jgi:hypothetical protein